MVYQFGMIFEGTANVFSIAAVLGIMIYMIFKPYKESDTLAAKVKVQGGSRDEVAR